jgi:hypothetical protein
MEKLLSLAAALTSGLFAMGQEDNKVKFSGYVEAYYGYDFNKPADHNRPHFIYSHNRTNEVNLNLGFIKANYQSENIRANIAVMAGTYANANLAAEPGVLKNVFEANAGIKLSQSENLWLDVGIMPSHIGFESAVSKDCWVLTRNISSENTPYYESGARLTYSTKDGKLIASLLYLNGWQRITRQDGNNKPAGGIQLTWKPTSGISVNYSNYLGTEGADSIRVKRLYHNLYGVFQINDQLGLTLGFDYGTQQKEKDSDERNKVVSSVAILQYKFAEKWALAGRTEHYKDRNGVFISTGSANGFNTMGYSVNVDYSPVPNAVVRLEGKMYDSKDKIFNRNSSMVNANSTITASIAVAF